MSHVTPRMPDPHPTPKPTMIAVASGKGGTGKTTVAVNLAVVSDDPITLMDCDVEEPNVHLFLKPELSTSERFAVMYPAFDEKLCDGCGKCREACRFNAIAVFGTSPMVFPELCHSCGACVYACPTGAVEESEREIGTIQSGTYEHVTLIHGSLDIGEARSSPLIERVRRTNSKDDLAIVDAPPGTSCPVIAAVRGVDYVLLVTEPTPFGLHDLRLAVEMCRELGQRFGVIVNMSGLGDESAREYCNREGITVLAEIPFDREVAEIYSRGEIPAKVLREYRSRFRDLLTRVQQEANP